MPKPKSARSSARQARWARALRQAREEGFYLTGKWPSGPRQVLELRGRFDVRCICPPDWEELSEFEHYYWARTLTDYVFDQLMGWSDEIRWHLGVTGDLLGSYEKVIGRLQASDDEKEAALATELTWMDEAAQRREREVSSAPTPEEPLLPTGMVRFISSLLQSSGASLDQVKQAMLKGLVDGRGSQS